jgi:hypothetical protein
MKELHVLTWKKYDALLQGEADWKGCYGAEFGDTLPEKPDLAFLRADFRACLQVLLQAKKTRLGMPSARENAFVCWLICVKKSEIQLPKDLKKLIYAKFTELTFPQSRMIRRFEEARQRKAQCVSRCNLERRPPAGLAIRFVSRLFFIEHLEEHFLEFHGCSYEIFCRNFDHCDHQNCPTHVHTEDGDCYFGWGECERTTFCGNCGAVLDKETVDYF